MKEREKERKKERMKERMTGRNKEKKKERERESVQHSYRLLVCIISYGLPLGEIYCVLFTEKQNHIEEIMVPVVNYPSN